MFKMVIDPVCGMEIDPAKALATRQVEDQTFYFCSNFCAQLFDPEMTEQELVRLRAVIGGEPNQRRTMPLWWVTYWVRKGIQALQERYPGGKS
jgi:YHS domain-containing protein